MHGKERFGIGARVRVRIPGVKGVVSQVDDEPTSLGEYWHKVKTEHGERNEPGCNLELVPKAQSQEAGRVSGGDINLNLGDRLNESGQLDDRLPLFRRGVFDTDLVQLSQEALESASSLVMIMFDLDHFKTINDTHKHAIGDEVLLGASKVVADRVKGKGRAYRWGGDEFAVLLSNYTSDEGVALAETIRKQVEQSVFSEKKLSVTMSVGLAALPEHARNSSEVSKAADSALYQAKELGRNLVRVFGEEKPAQRERVPERKSPEPGALSEDDCERVRVAYFSGHQPECPKDGVPLRVLKEFHAVGLKTPSIIVMCPVCGVQETIHGLS